MNPIYSRMREIHEYSLMYPEKFWDTVARELFWYKLYEKVIESHHPYYYWFKGGKINITYNILDIRKNSNKIALYWESENGENISLSYKQLYNLVSSFAGALTQLGLKKGDVVTIYMPMIPEAMVAMLACARIGVIHNVVFAGFGEKALRERIEIAGSKAIITADIGYRRGKEISYLDVVENATKDLSLIKITVPRGSKVVGHSFYDLLDAKKVDAVPMDSQDPLFILFTSGTTGKPKGVVHSVGPYTVWAYYHVKWLLNFDDTSTFFSTADIGWINGHSYSTYGTLLNNGTLLWYEGVPDYPDPQVWWRLVEEYKVTDIWTAPTAIRLLMKYGSKIDHDISSLRMIISAGEILGEEAWKWLVEITSNKVYVIETWGQTENSGFITSPGGFYIGGIYYKKGSVGYPLPGINIAIYDDNGRELPPNTKGNIVIKSSAPAFMSSLWHDDERYRKYYEKFGVYLTGDYGYMDEEGYLYILGRIDDLIKVAGHRISPAEIENIVLSNEEIADAAVVGKKDEIKGNVLVVFASLKHGFLPSEELKNKIMSEIKKNYGGIAVIDDIIFADKLPKTRTGKIMRRVLRALINNEELGDLSTLEEREAIEDLRKRLGEKIGK